MSKSEVTVDHVESLFAAHRAKIAEREERIQREEQELERERAALVDEARRYFDGRLLALREKAIVAADTAAKALAALPPKPVEPRPADVETLGWDAYLERCEAYPAARKAYDQQALTASRPLAAALRGLEHEAGAVRRQAISYGVPPYQGVGFLHEAERKVDAVRGTALIAFAHQGAEWLEVLTRAAECGELTAAQAIALAALLRRKPEQAPIQEPPASIWQRIQRLAAKREEREYRSQTLRDADRIMLQPEQQQRLAFERQMGLRP